MSIRLFITKLNLIANHIIFSLLFLPEQFLDGLLEKKGGGGVCAKEGCVGGTFHLDRKSIILVFQLLRQ